MKQECLLSELRVAKELLHEAFPGDGTSTPPSDAPSDVPSDWVSDSKATWPSMGLILLAGVGGALRLLARGNGGASDRTSMTRRQAEMEALDGMIVMPTSKQYMECLPSTQPLKASDDPFYME